MGNSLMAVLIKDGEELAEWGKGPHCSENIVPNATGQQTLCRKPLKPSELNVENLLWGILLRPPSLRDLQQEKTSGPNYRLHRRSQLQGPKGGQPLKSQARGGPALGQRIFLKHQITNISVWQCTGSSLC